MSDGTLDIDFHGHRLVLHPAGAIWWPATRSLILSDVHLGKSATFRAHGIPVPEGETPEDLLRIEQLVSSHETESLLIVGDLIHSSLGLSPGVVDALSSWFDRLPCQSILIRGNHDPSPDRLSAIRGLDIVDQFEIAGISFIHDPADLVGEEPTIAGHMHPLCRIGTRHGPKLRLPCFYRYANYLLLPAFGTFTSGNLIPEPAFDVYPIAEGKVFARPRASGTRRAKGGRRGG